MSELIFRADGAVALPGPHRFDPALTPSLGHWYFHLGLDLGQAQDPSALAVIEDKCLPLPSYDATGRQKLGDRTLTVVSAERLDPCRYTVLARQIAAVRGRDPFAGRASLAVDATGVGRAFVDVLDEEGVDHHKVQITGGASVNYSDGFWNASKLLLLSDLAAQIETGQLQVAGDLPMKDELKREFDAFQVKNSTAGNQLIEVVATGHHGDMVMAIALALFGATRATSGATRVLPLAGWY